LPCRAIDPLSATACQRKGLAFAQRVLAGARQLVRDGLEGHDGIGLGFLAFIEALGFAGMRTWCCCATP
jgi:hypothetical protein